MEDDHLDDACPLKWARQSWSGSAYRFGPSRTVVDKHTARN